MSHALRTPLNAMVGLTGLLAQSSLGRRQRNYTSRGHKLRFFGRSKCVC
jgi:signal transduction histidine kinase